MPFFKDNAILYLHFKKLFPAFQPTFQEIVSGVSAIVSRIRLQQADHVRIPEKSQGIL